MRIGVSSSSFRRPLAAGELTQLEWVERCATVLGVDGIVAAIADFPRLDRDYVAQVRKIAVDLGVVPFGIDAPALLDPAAAPDDVTTLSIATDFGALVARTVLPSPGTVPPADFAAAVARTKAACRLAKAANVTLLVAARAGTLGADHSGVAHLLKDVDSAWARACPLVGDAFTPTARDRFPARTATIDTDPTLVAATVGHGWVILDAEAPADPFAVFSAAIAALRSAEPRTVRSS